MVVSSLALLGFEARTTARVADSCPKLGTTDIGLVSCSVEEVSVDKLGLK